MVAYPNPARVVLNLEYTATSTSVLELQVVDARGALMMKTNMPVTAGRNNMSINVAGFSQGVYFIRYQDLEGKQSMVRFVKQ